MSTNAIIQRDDPGPMRVVISPYRICPLGAHSDHQGGPTLGMAISAHTVLTFTADPGSTVRLTSANFPGEVLIDLKNLESVDDHPDQPPWSRYVAAAVLALRDRMPKLPNGIRGHVGGALPGAGLSSSASVLLAYLSALAEVNEIGLSPEDKARLALRAEREFVGIKVGILDPATIVGARRGQLLAIDTRAGRWEAFPLGADAPEFQILIAASGVTRNLAATDYNRRVEECFAACAKLAALAGVEGVVGLHDLDDAVFDEHGESLPPPELRRARHFFTERARVHHGIDLWKRGDIAGFGELMNASCQSSIENWETGSPELIELQQKLTQTRGVYGSRFSGAGFGGCVVALVDDFDEVASSIPGNVFRVDSDDGLRLL